MPPGGDEDDHRLADRARDREHEAGDDPEMAAGTTMRVETWSLRCAEPEGAVAELLGHGAHRVLGDGGDGRDQHHAHDQARPRATLKMSTPDPDVLEQRREEGQREEPEDDGRDAREHLERGLEDVADARPRVLAQVDGRAEPAGESDDAGPEGDDAAFRRAAAARRTRPARRAAPSARRRRSRGSRPRGRTRSTGSSERDDDPDRRRDRDQRAEGERDLDDSPRPSAGPRRAAGRGPAARLRSCRSSPRSASPPAVSSVERFSSIYVVGHRDEQRVLGEARSRLLR